MPDRAMFIILIVVGAALVLLSLFAHQLGIASGGFGLKKIAGLVVGVILLAVGIWGVIRQSAVART